MIAEAIMQMQQINVDPVLMIQLLVNGLLRGSIYALMAFGLTLTFGIMKVINYAHGDFFMLGAYATYFVIVLSKLDFLVAVALSGALLLIIGIAIERFILRPLRRVSGSLWVTNAFVLTLGLSLVIENSVLFVWKADARIVSGVFPGSMNIHGVVLIFQRLVILVATLLVVTSFLYFVNRTYVGKGIRATSENEQVAKTLGLNIDFLYMLSFGIASLLAGLAGGLLLPLYGAFPSDGLEPLLKGFAVVLIGGLASIRGSLYGGLLLGVFESFATFFFSAGWNNVLVVVLVMIVLLFKPEGLFKQE